MDDFTSLVDYTPAKHRRILLYGAPGSGKSIFSCGSQWMRTVVGDVENGLDSVLNFKGATGVLPPRKDLIKAEHIPNVEDWIPFLEKVNRNCGRFDLMVVDSVTEMMRRADEKSRATSVRYNQPMPRILSDKQDWGYVLNLCTGFLRLASIIPIHQIYTVHEYTETVGGNKFISPKLYGQAKDVFEELTNETWRIMVLDKPDPSAPGGIRPMFGLQCIKSEFVRAKTRSLDSSDMFISANIDSVFAKILGTTTA